MTSKGDTLTGVDVKRNAMGPNHSSDAVGAFARGPTILRRLSAAFQS